jgi:hypothetical protein
MTSLKSKIQDPRNGGRKEEARQQTLDGWNLKRYSKHILSNLLDQIHFSTPDEWMNGAFGGNI